MNLFHSLKCKGFSYSIVNAARSVLSTFMTVDGYDLELHNLKLTLSKYSFRWDVAIVLKHLSKLTNESVFDLSGKLATLLTVLCGHRAREILGAIDLKNISFGQDLLVIRIRDVL